LTVFYLYISTIRLKVVFMNVILLHSDHRYIINISVFLPLPTWRWPHEWPNM